MLGSAGFYRHLPVYHTGRCSISTSDDRKYEIRGLSCSITCKRERSHSDIEGPRKPSHAGNRYILSEGVLRCLACSVSTGRMVSRRRRNTPLLSPRSAGEIWLTHEGTMEDNNGCLEVVRDGEPVVAQSFQFFPYRFQSISGFFLSTSRHLSQPAAVTLS